MFVMLVRHPDAFQGITLATSLHVSSSCIDISYFVPCRWDRVPIVCVLVFSQVRPWAMYLGLGLLLFHMLFKGHLLCTHDRTAYQYTQLECERA